MTLPTPTPSPPPPPTLGAPPHNPPHPRATWHHSSPLGNADSEHLSTIWSHPQPVCTTLSHYLLASPCHTPHHSVPLLLAAPRHLAHWWSAYPPPPPPPLTAHLTCLGRCRHCHWCALAHWWRTGPPPPPTIRTICGPCGAPPPLFTGK